MVRDELLERSVEMAALDAAVRSVTGGSGSAVVVSGAPGLGKTRLLRHTRASALASGLRVLAGRGSELEREYALGIVRQLFEPLLARTGTEERDGWLGGAAAAVRPLLGHTVGNDVLAGEFAILHGLYWLTANLCQDGPLAMVIDDLHWADEPSLRFVSYLLPRLEDLPLLVVAGTRPYEAGTASALVDRIVVDPSVRTVRLVPLSAAASGAWLSGAFGSAPEAEFAAACYEATGGNPLLLSELAQALIGEKLTPTAASAPYVLQIGAHAVARRVALQLARLAPADVQLAEAVAVTGSGVDLTGTARLAGLATADAAVGMTKLAAANLVRPLEEANPAGGYEFVHPMVRAAVYGQIPSPRRWAFHADAVALLGESSARAEARAAHLLRLPPTGDPEAIVVLRQSASEALARAAPEAAHAYLKRCLEEPMDKADRVNVLVEAGLAAQLIDTAEAAGHLETAMALLDDPVRRAVLAGALGELYIFLQRFDDATTICVEALKALPADEDEVARRLQAGLVLSVILVPHQAELSVDVHELLDLSPQDTPGGRALAGLLALLCSYESRREALTQARVALADHQLIADAPGSAALVSAWLAMVSADQSQALDSLETAVTTARRRGAVRELVGALTYRMLARSRRGELADAEVDGRECMWAVDASNMVIGRAHVGPWLAEVLIERGALTAAERVMSWVDLPDPFPPAGPLMYYLMALARLRRAQGNLDEALKLASAAGSRFAELGGDNPALVPWRSETALCLHSLGRFDEARAHVFAELEMAERFGAPGAIGRALRVAGLCAGGSEGLDLLHRSVEALQPSPCRLEHAKAMIDCGAALRRSGNRRQALMHLRAGFDLAEVCGATPLVEQSARELRIAGASPRRTMLTGVAALTPSELRIAELAMQYTNRDIAQQLFVTPKTVEVHLSNAYRKLGITSRRQLTTDRIAETPPPTR